MSRRGPGWHTRLPCRTARPSGVAHAFHDVASAIGRFSHPERSELEAELAQGLFATRAFRRKVDSGGSHDGRDPPRSGVACEPSLAMVRVMRDETHGSV